MKTNTKIPQMSQAIQASRPSTPPLLPPLPSLFKPTPRKPVLTFAPLAWLKLKFFLHAQDVEIGGFGVSSEDDLLYIEDFVTVKQAVSVASVEFDDAAVADHFDRCADQGIAPSRCGRIWLHTHPGSSPMPSSTDERTFRRVFGPCDWAVMAIVARGGETYARLRFNAGPSGQVPIAMEVDWERFAQEVIDLDGQMNEVFTAWQDEYGQNIFEQLWAMEPSPALQAAASGVAQPAADDRQATGSRTVWDEMDELYDQRMWEAGWGYTEHEEMHA